MREPVDERVERAVAQLARDGIEVTARVDGESVVVHVVRSSLSGPDTWWRVFKAFVVLGYGVRETKQGTR